VFWEKTKLTVFHLYSIGITELLYSTLFHGIKWNTGAGKLVLKAKTHGEGFIPHQFRSVVKPHLVPITFLHHLYSMFIPWNKGGIKVE